MQKTDQNSRLKIAGLILEIGRVANSETSRLLTRALPGFEQLPGNLTGIRGIEGWTGLLIGGLDWKDLDIIDGII